VWSPRFGPADHAAALARACDSISLYAHVPFCREMCTYCGCNVIVTRDRRRMAGFVRRLADEAAVVARTLGARRQVARINLGGGSPTDLDDAELDALLAALAERFDILPFVELAVEVMLAWLRLA